MWYAEIQREGCFFFAKMVEPGTRLAAIPGAVRVFAPRPDWKDERPRYLIAEGPSLDRDHFFLCSATSCNCTSPNWVTETYDLGHVARGARPCENEAAIGIATEGYDHEAIVVCAAGDHIAVYDSGLHFNRQADFTLVPCPVCGRRIDPRE